MDITSPTRRTKPTAYQAVKILNKISKNYAHLLSANEQAYLEDYLRDLHPSERDIDQTALLIAQILEPAIDQKIESIHDQIEDAQNRLEETELALVKIWQQENKTNEEEPTSILVDEATAEVLDYYQDRISTETLPLYRAIADSRSLRRALLVLAPQSQPEITQDWAEDRIMEIAYG